MKVKHRSVCQNCRSRKLGCDGKYPQCSQCLLKGRQCPGYPANWSFVQSGSESAQIGGSISEAPNQDHDPPNISQDAPSHENLHCGITNGAYTHQSMAVHGMHREQVDLIIRSFVPDEELHIRCNLSNEPRPRICGSWVEVLPDLLDSTGNEVVLAALHALASSIVSQRPGRGITSADGPHSYLTAIRIMRKELSNVDYSLDRELLASIMCLSLVELMFPGSTEGLTMHTNAIARIIEANGPERYQTGVLHRLFIGFRPLLMIKAIQDRTPLFLGSEKWQRTPFAIFIPSPMQSLLSRTAILPSLLQRMDRHFGQSLIQDECEDIRLFNCFRDILISLNEWEASVSNSESQPLYWYQGQDTEVSEMPPIKIPCIWFPGITMTNALTYIWSFRIICLYEIEHLAFSRPQPSFDYSRAFGELRIKNILHNAQTLVSQICQSMEYLLQDEMKLFGPASAVLPLQVAYAVATMYPSLYQVELAVITKVIDRLVGKGLQSYPSYIFEKNPFVHRWDTLSIYTQQVKFGDSLDGYS